MEEILKQRKVKTDDERYFPKTYKFRKQQLDDIESSSKKFKTTQAEFVRSAIDQGLQVVNVRRDGYTVQLILFTRMQIRSARKQARELDITVDELINSIVMERFK